jgi:hypothetical protein
MYVVNELEIFGKKNELEYLYNNFNFDFIKKKPRYLLNYYDIKEWCYNNWGTDTEMKLINKILVWDRLEQKISFLFETNFPPLKIINLFVQKNPHLQFKLYYYDYYDSINVEFEWNNGIIENHFVYKNLI